VRNKFTPQQRIEILTDMYREAKENKMLTNWHLNDFFLDFCDKYYLNKTVKTAKGSFGKFANILVDLGILHKAKRMGIGAGGMNEFGTRSQTAWTFNFCARNKDEKEALSLIRGYVKMKYSK